MNGTDIQLTVIKNPFKALDREVLTVSADYTFAQLYANLGLHYPISYAMFIDGDEIVADIHAKPKSQHVYIKIMPSGSNREQGAGMKIAGVALIVAGAVLSAYGLGAVGVPLIGMGVSLVIGGVALYNLNIPKIGAPTDINQNSNYSLAGSENTARPGGRVPVLLGRHIIVPDIIASPMIDASGQDQTIMQTFCGGYDDIKVESGTYKIGDTPLTNDYYTYILSENVGNSYPATLQNWCKNASIQAELDGTQVDDALPDYNATEIIRTTPAGIYRINFFFNCPGGIGKYDKNGNLNEFAINVKIQYRTNEGGVVGPWKNYPNPGYFLYDKPIYNQNYNPNDPNNNKQIIGYEPIYSAPNTGIVRISGKTQTAYRAKFIYTLSNDNSSGADYTPSRRYDIRIVRASNKDTSSGTLDRVYLDFLRYDIAFWNPSKDSNPYKLPSVSGSTVPLKVHSLRILASENANGTVRNFNYIGQTYINVYSGSGSGSASWSGKALTSNPAALFLYVLRTHYINNHQATDSQIDWPAFEAWYTYCNTKSFTCNYHASGEFKVSDLLDVIAHAGRASWSIIDAKFTIVIDDVRSNVVQAFTPRNTWNFSGQKLFVDRPTALRMKFVDETINFQPAERVVYYDDNSPDDTLVQEVSVTGVTNPDQIYKMAKYQLACTYLRPEIFSFEVDAEQLACLRGDRVKLNHDVPLIGLSSGRISALNTSGPNDVSIVVDENCIFEPAKTYAVQIRKSDGSVITKALTNPATTVNVESVILTFATPFTSGSIAAGNLFMFGESGEESLDLLVMDIEPGSDLTAKLTCVPYSPDVYNADSGTIPDYDPIVSIPADIENTVKLGIPVDVEKEATRASSAVVETDTRSIAMTSTTPSGEVLPFTLETNESLFMPSLPLTQYEAYDLITDRFNYIAESIIVGGTSNLWASIKQFLRSSTTYTDFIAGKYYPIAPGVVYDYNDNQIFFNYNGVVSVIEDATPICARYANDTLIYIRLSDGKVCYTTADGSIPATEIYEFAEFVPANNRSGLACSDGRLFINQYNSDTTNFALLGYDINETSTEETIEYPSLRTESTTIPNTGGIGPLYRDIIAIPIANDPNDVIKVGTKITGFGLLESSDYRVEFVSTDATYKYIDSLPGGGDLIGNISFELETGDTISVFASTTKSVAVTYSVNLPGGGQARVRTLKGELDHGLWIISGSAYPAVNDKYNFVKSYSDATYDYYDTYRCSDFLSMPGPGAGVSETITVKYYDYAPLDAEYDSNTAIWNITNNPESLGTGFYWIKPTIKKGKYAVKQRPEYYPISVYGGRWPYAYFVKDAGGPNQNTIAFTYYPMDDIVVAIPDPIYGFEHKRSYYVQTTINRKQLTLSNKTEIDATLSDKIHQVKYVGNDTLLVSTADMEIYRVTDEAAATPQLFDGGALYFDANETDIVIQENDTGNIYFASTQQSLAKVDEKPYIQATSQAQNFQAVLISGSNKLMVYSDSWYNKIDVGAFISGTGIPANSYVINKRNNEVYINVPATASGEKTLSIVSTSRKYYEPNDIIRDGARFGTRKYAGAVNYLAMPIPETGMGFFTCKEYTIGANSTDSTKIATGIFNYVDNTNYSLSVLSGTSANFTAQIIDGKMNIVFDKTGGGYAGQDPEITIMRLS